MSNMRSSSPYDYENTRLQTAYSAGPQLTSEAYESTRLTTDSNPHPKPAPPRLNASAVRPSTERVIVKTRIGLRIISFLMSASLLGILAHVVATYLATKNKYVKEAESEVRLSVWLTRMKMKPIYVVLGAAAVTTFLSIVMLLASFKKSMRKVTAISNFSTAIVSMIGFLLWLGASLYYKNGNPFVSYTCGLRNNSDVLSVVNMKALCLEMKYVRWVLIFVGLFELFSSATVSWAMWAARKKGAYARI